MGRHIIEMYLFYINPYQTQVLLRYQDGSYSKTILKVIFIVTTTARPIMRISINIFWMKRIE